MLLLCAFFIFLVQYPVVPKPFPITFDSTSTFDTASSHIGGPGLLSKTFEKTMTSLSVNIPSIVESISSSEQVGAGRDPLHIGLTMDDLCHAAAQLERMDASGDEEKDKVW